MRILFIPSISIPAKGGGAVFMYETASWLRDEGHSVHFAQQSAIRRSDYCRLSKRSQGSVRSEDGFTFHPCRTRSLAPLVGYAVGRQFRRFNLFSWLELQSAPPGYQDLSELVSALRPDVIHAVSFPQAYNYDALLASRETGVPLFITPFYHYRMIGTGNAYHDINANRLLLEVLQEADGVMVCTRAERNQLVSINVKADRIVTIPMGVHPNAGADISPDLFRNAYGLRDEVIVLDMSTQKCWGKGSLLTLEALSRVQKKHPKVVFVSAGQTSREWDAAIASHSGRVIDLDYIDGDMKQSAFSAADVFVHPSRNDAFGIVFLEAWSAGCPVIAADIEAMRDVVSDGEDGFLVPVDNVDALVERVEQLVLDPVLRSRLGRAGRNKAQEYDWDNVSKRVMAAYSATIERRTAAERNQKR